MSGIYILTYSLISKLMIYKHQYKVFRMEIDIYST